MTLTFGYWKSIGIVQGIRLLLRYVEANYQEDFYINNDDGTDHDWFKVKYSKGLEFPNLPYLIDGNLKITQSSSILFHLGQKFNLIGETLEERTSDMMLQQEVFDLRMIFLHHCYQSKAAYEESLESFKEKLNEKLKLFSEYLSDKKWLTGNKIKYPDFDFYSLLEALKKYDAHCLDPFSNLIAYMSGFEALPQIKAYQESVSYIKWPVMGPGAAWGNKET